MRNRWIVLIAGCLIQIVLGGIYAWSTFVPYLMKGYGLSAGQCGFIFGLTILVFTSAMLLSGRVLTKRGPRITATIGAVLFMTGYLAASCSGGSFPLLLLCLGGIVGAGIGFGYVCPLSVGMKWFPNQKGLVTGVAVAGFGGGAVLLSSIAEQMLLHGMNTMIFFRWFGLCSGVVLLGAAALLSEPETHQIKRSGDHAATRLSWPLSLASIGMFAGTFAGLLIVGNLAPLTMAGGLSEEQATLAVSIFAIGNAVGRITWGHAFDRLGYCSIPTSLFSFALVSLLLLFPLPPWLLLLTVGCLGFGFGANFVIYASAISRYFGAASFAHLYPVCFLAYGVAGLIGPGIGGYLTDLTNSYAPALYLCIGLVTAAGLLSAVRLRVFTPQ